LTGQYPFYGQTYEELQSNMKIGAYKIPRNVTISGECLEFLYFCLRFDTFKRFDIEKMMNHPFLNPDQGGPSAAMR
jgi:hypothetical protein